MLIDTTGINPSLNTGGTTLETWPAPIFSVTDPTSGDIGFPLSQIIINTANGKWWGLSSITSNSANWVQIAPTSTGSFTSITATGSISAGTTLTAGTGITSTTGNIAATAGNVTAGAAVSATTTVTAGTDLISTNGNVILNGLAKQVRIKGGNPTDFIGQATLINGVATIANTNIAATDRIIVNRTAVNASTALGTFKTVITAATNFVITACKPADATTETNDQSTVDYVIIRQL